MSLRVDDKRSRSKSPGRGRSRSHSHSQAYHGLPAEQPAAAPHYETRQPGQQYATPHHNVQYAPTPQQYAYTSTPATHATPASMPPPIDRGSQYAQSPNTNAYNATQPQYAPMPPPTVQPQYAPMPPSTFQPQHAPIPPSGAQHMHAPPPPTQPMYAPPPMGSHSPRPEHRRAISQPTPVGTYDGRKLVEIVPGGGGGGGGVGGAGRGVGGGGNLSIATAGMHGGFADGALPPPSPLLEAYHGTYQSISPMPQAMMLDDDLSHLSLLDSRSPRASSHSLHDHRPSLSPTRRPAGPPSRPSYNDKLALEAYGHGRPVQEKEKRRMKAYDATDDAVALVDALAPRTPNTDTLIEILPALSHDEMLELRAEYKRHCKVQGRGINVAKHIKLKTSGNFGKIAYVTALGKYEGEGYWANYWYQSNSARRELLIEALMGRQNREIREIKEAFKDKRYSDSLTRCMDKELKADKFRKAVLMALEGERQEESDVWPVEYVHRDVDTLYRAIKTRDGGESTMLSIVIMRSDSHLREVLRMYERKYQASFARDALRKSNNLVGEVIAHILNGVINRPARDAMLLHHALMDLIEPTSDGPRSSSSKHERQQRFELLISRLVRIHWDRMHFVRVEHEYEEKYGRVVEEDLEEATRGDFREFCLAICQTAR